MAKGGVPKGDNTKKVAGNAKKAAAAAEKAAVEQARQAAAEDEKWQQGSKSNAKKEAEAAKKADAARKKAEKDALLAEEEAANKAKPKNNPKAGSKTTTPKKGLDLGQLDGDTGPGGPNGNMALSASNIDDALDALSLTQTPAGDKVERHPERRFKAAYKAFEERRLPELEEERPGLRKNQRVELCRKEFEKHPDNPFNQVSVRFDASRDEIREVKKGVRESTERRLGNGK